LSDVEAWLTRRWYNGPAPLALRPLSALYGAAMALRRSGYAHGWFASHDAGKPVLVVGNITVGGTGKTPLVIWLAQHFSAQGLKVGIVSRGHGRTDSAPREVHEGDDWRLVGDEPLLLARHSGCPVIVAIDRVEGARRLAARGVDVIVADDGLQHLRLRRNCEIAVIDGARGLGNGALLPAGPLREPSERLASVDALVLNGAARSGFEVARETFQMTLVMQEPASLASASAAPPDFRGRRVHAVAGTGHPARFFSALKARGIDVIEHPFPDHHAFSESDLDFGDSLPVLMTEKDAVKCRSFADPRLWYVPVAVQFGGREGQTLLEKVLRKLGVTTPARG
jgi:tetraacyldisaccharide 4'-kinase